VDREPLLRWIGNVSAVTLLPMYLGVSGEPLWLFLIYAVVAAVVLTLAEDPDYFGMLRARPDVRCYVQARMLLTVLFGLLTFTLASFAVDH
jgi:hypothetical protein